MSRATPAILAELRGLYEGGLTSYEIAARVGLHPNTVIEYLREAGCEIRSRAANGERRVQRDRLPRFMRFIRHDGDCWTWTGHVGRHGYGQCYVNRTTVLAHRWFYERLVGAIPDGLVLDHLCRNRACVNPAHLEPVTHRVNLRRGSGVNAQNAAKTHCAWGHSFEGANVRWNGNHRVCVACSRRYRADYERRKAERRVCGHPLPPLALSA